MLCKFKEFLKFYYFKFSQACLWLMLHVYFIFNPVQCLWFTGVDVVRRNGLKWTETNMQDVMSTEEMLQSPPWCDLRYQNGKKVEIISNTKRDIKSSFLLFLHFDLQISKAWYEHVGGLLCSDTRNCRYINSGVIEHCYSSHDNNASMHKQRLILEMMCQHLE